MPQRRSDKVVARLKIHVGFVLVFVLEHDQLRPLRPPSLKIKPGERHLGGLSALNVCIPSLLSTPYNV